MGEWESKAYRPHPPKNKQARKGEGGGTARRVRSAKASGSRALLNRAYYRKGVEHALEAVERELHNWERSLEEKHQLLGHPVVEERVRYMPFMRESAEVARVRLVVTCAIQRLLEPQEHLNE